MTGQLKRLVFLLPIHTTGNPIIEVLMEKGRITCSQAQAHVEKIYHTPTFGGQPMERVRIGKVTFQGQMKYFDLPPDIKKVWSHPRQAAYPVEAEEIQDMQEELERRQKEAGNHTQASGKTILSPN